MNQRWRDPRAERGDVHHVEQHVTLGSLFGDCLVGLLRRGVGDNYYPGAGQVARLVLAVDPFDTATVCKFAKGFGYFNVGAEQFYVCSAFEQVFHLAFALMGVAPEYDSGAVFHVEENTVIARHGVLRFRAGGRGCLAGEPGSADRLEFFNDELVFDKIPDAGFLEFAPAVNEHALFKTGRFGDFTTELLTFFFRNAVDHCEV